MTLTKTRKDYGGSPPLDLGPDPIDAFRSWYQDAVESQMIEPNAMALATCSSEGQPSVRMVLLKDVSQDGFSFFTNYRSRKGREIEQNARVALCWYWDRLERQVRVNGRAERLPEEVSDRYFSERPRGAQVSACVSQQSELLLDREVLHEEWQAFEEAHQVDTLPRPAHWGGYLVRPDQIEFWQGAPSRMHDRLLYTSSGPAGWRLERLYP